MQEGRIFRVRVCVWGVGGWAQTCVYLLYSLHLFCEELPQEFSQWPLEVFPFHMVAAVQFFGFLFIPT